uniref:Uncharacterized protein n=1 Tax=Vespula pensylvanica TaxID=30213 RepID=A0A834PFF6_VESPE|nr:hypothetical protein H0235_001075 [Vespula pensylvanica]
MRGHSRSIENDLCTSCACVCARASLRYVRLLYLPLHRKRRKLPIPHGSLLNHAGYLLALPPGDAWSRLATMANLLDKLNYTRTVLIQAKDAEGREDELELVKLPEDTTLAGFTPLMSNPQDPCYVEKTEDMDIAQVCLRISKVLFFGQVFLCGLETPVLKLQKNEIGMSEYVSVVEASSISSPSSPPEQSDSELLVESYSEDEDGPVSTMKRLPSSNDVFDDNGAPLALGEIRSLIERKEELERKQRKQDRHRQRVQVSGKKASPVARDRLAPLAIDKDDPSILRRDRSQLRSYLLSHYSCTHRNFQS